MSGKRILDLIAIFSATCEVAQKHIALRSKQLELYSKTSSITRAIRSQTIAVTQDLKKSPNLASHYHELSPTIEILKKTSEIKSSSVGNPELLLGTEPSKYANHVNQDSVRLDYSSSQEQNLQESLVTELPEKLISQAANSCTESKHNSRVKCPGLEESDVSVPNSQDKSSPQAVPGEQEISEDINTNLFHSPRVAKLLNGKVQKNPGSALYSKHLNNSKIPKNTTSKKHQDNKPFQLSPTPFPAPSDSNLEVSENRLLTSSKPLQKNPGLTSNSYELRESKVPSSRIARIWNYGSLAAGMFGGVVSESLRRASGRGSEGSIVLNSRNMDRLVSNLSRMRGAALKLGQMISFQDSKMFPGPVVEVLQRVQDRADYMPSYQRDSVLAKNLGPAWRDHFSSFDEIPIAAASIGQVHRAVLKSNGIDVAVKVQYPGVAESISSDLKNLEMLLTASKLLPKGLYLDKTIANARTELAWECNYEREADYTRQFRHLLRDDTNVFQVPEIFSEASGKQVLTMEFMNGIGMTKIKTLSQERKDWIGTQILRLCLREITEFRLMQTDPNWTNFLLNEDTQKLALLDFGASREYSPEFIAKYTQLLVAASRLDKDTVKTLSEELGYLTGFESKSMVNAHVTSILTLAEPFLDSSPQLYDFRGQTITDRVTELIPLMMRERLTPPPEETYSLHRKLSGAFLLCARLGSRVPCRRLFEESFQKAGIL
ncbi:hypothetical protein K3495_g2920 [Podosphaera aphanis]|nr:hypothetical protein K3495_g2920 [Podosphaera aphanis]